MKFHIQNKTLAKAINSFAKFSSMLCLDNFVLIPDNRATFIFPPSIQYMGCVLFVRQAVVIVLNTIMTSLCIENSNYDADAITNLAF